MKAAEFDRFAEEYRAQHKANIAISGEDPAYFAAYKIKILANTLAGRGGHAEKILDFGSGIGNSVPYFREYLPASSVTCADISKKSMELSQLRFPGDERYLEIEGEHIPGDDGSFDAVFSACVFHHIPNGEHIHWLSELHRLTKSGGTIMVFEHNPWNPLTVRAINSCPFDRNARLISARQFASRFHETGWRDVQIRYHVFFPRALTALRVLDCALSWFPLGAQYAVTATRPS